MTIIEEMREIACALRISGPPSAAKDLTDIIGHLERSGALVPVPDGEACGYDLWCSSMSRMGFVNDVLAFNDGDQGYCTNAITGRLMEFREDEDGNWDEPTVQPARLVSITEVQINED